MPERQRVRSLKPFAGTLVVLALVIVQAGASRAQDATPAAAPGCAPEGAEVVEIPEAKLYVEYNATDGDVGVHAMLDTDGYTLLCVFDPNGTQILAVEPHGELRDLGLGSFFAESREPPTSEFGFDELEAAFPEGDYAISGTLFDGTGVAGTATFTHDVPAPPAIVAPELAEDEERAADATVPSEGLVVEWEDVTETVDGNPVDITAYEVIVTKVEHDDPNGLSRPIFDVHLPPDRNALTVSAGFLEPETAYEVEVLALEASGNQTISLGFFVTEP